MPYFPPIRQATYQSDGSDPTVGAILVTRTATAEMANRITTARFRNVAEVTGTNDYQNEVQIVLQAGASADHRRYLRWVGHDDNDDWVAGANAKNVFILYDQNTPVHRLWLENDSDAPNDTGNSYINSAGTGAVIFNGLNDGTENEGTGGIQVYSGGASPTKVFSVDATGHYGAVGAINSRYTANVTGTYTQSAGGSVGGMLLQPVHSPDANTTVVMNGINANPSTAGNFTMGTLQGMSTIATHGASNTLSNLVGGFFVAQNTVAQTVAAAIGGNFQVQNTHASGTITSGTGVNVAAPSNSGTMTNYYGVRVLDATAASLTAAFRGGMLAGTGKWNLYLDGTANNHISGNVALGSTTAPTALMHLAAGNSSRAQIRFVDGVEPSTRNDGDMWREGNALHIYFGSTEYTLDMTAV